MPKYKIFVEIIGSTTVYEEIVEADSFDIAQEMAEDFFYDIASWGVEEIE